MNATEDVGALDQYAFVILPGLLVAERFGIPLLGISQEYEGRAESPQPSGPSQRQG